MRIHFFFLTLLAFPLAATADPALSIASEVFDNASLPFHAHTGPGAFGSYLEMEVPFAPVKAVLEALQPLVDRPLRSRSEAHITVISPPEFYQVLRPYVSIEEINTIAQAASIQQTKFTLICVGMAEAVIAGQKQQTYYLVASSPDLVQLRQQIFERYVERGGDRSHFDPAGFYPHVTVGFTLRDLQEGDGVKKGQNSCLYPLTVN